FHIGWDNKCTSWRTAELACPLGYLPIQYLSLRSCTPNPLPRKPIDFI
ncbi:hypothetical protein DBR06_SOUSAS2610017, partial [Sousa chinensis]